MIYGANGFTGHLVAVEAKRQGLCPVLAGRRAGPIEALADDLGLPARVFDLGHPRAAAAALADMAVMSHCAGPFSVTSAQMPALQARRGCQHGPRSPARSRQSRQRARTCRWPARHSRQMF
jgi:short subunit dehydrogenase-like uncharacterized protein